VLARDTSRPGVNRNLGGLQVRLEREAAEHRQAPEERRDAPVDHLLDAITPDLLLPVLGSFHADSVCAGRVRGISPQRRLVSTDTSPSGRLFTRNWSARRWISRSATLTRSCWRRCSVHDSSPAGSASNITG